MSEEKISKCMYEIKGRSFYQKQLVLGQLELLVDLLKDVELEKGLTNLGILKTLGGKMPRAMAIVLFEEGSKIEKIEVEENWKTIEVQEIKKQTEFFANNVNIVLALKVITDFFVCTPMTEIMQTLASLIPETQTPVQEPRPF